MAGAQRVRITWLLLCVLLSLSITADAKRGKKLSLLHRVHTYATTVDTANISKEFYSYSRAFIKVDKRNPILMLVPSAYIISRGGKREFLTERFSKIRMKNYSDFDTRTLLRISNIPSYRGAMSSFNRYMTPTIYDETVVGNTILSPFHPNNFKFYKYKVDAVTGDVVKLSFSGRRKNTQLVHGNAVIDKLTGRIISCNIWSEYDMVNALLSMTMGNRGANSLFPKDCDGLLRFNFLGNKVSAHYISNYGLNNALHGDGYDNADNPALMDSVRPGTLPAQERKIVDDILAAKAVKDTADTVATHKKRGSWVKRVFWDAVGDNVFNRIKMTFGQNSQGYLRINPVLNPLYMSYSDRRGFTYKFAMHANYQTGEDAELLGNLRFGYSFKIKQYYFRLPLYFYMSRRKNRYVKFEIGNGNRIRNNLIYNDMEQALNNFGNHALMIKTPDHFNEFTQTDARLVLNFDVNSFIGFQVGSLFQRYKAFTTGFFRAMDKPTHYSAFAPVFEVQYRPMGWSGPILTLDYDRGVTNVLNSNMKYERYEFNAEYIHHLNRLQALQMRLGAGFYSHKGRDTYFLNYENFKENNIPGGWNDDWSGEFELLRSDNYNSSPYYVRGNLTYESPLLLLSWLPIVGHYMEMERVYVSWLDAHKMHPYVELGYGFTTRFFSAGLFVSNGKGNRTFGCRFGLELFRHW